MSVGDVDSGIVKVVGKVNPAEVCDWLKRETRKNVQLVFPDPPVENANNRQKMILVLGRSSMSGNTAPSAPPLQDEMPCALELSGAQSYHESLHLIEEKIRKLEKIRDVLKIKNLEKIREVIEGSKKTLLDSALNQLKAYKNLEALSQSPWD